MICKRCGTVFCDDYAGESAGVRRYCSKSCKQRRKPAERRRRSRLRRSDRSKNWCPNPQKMRYLDLVQADAAAQAAIEGKTLYPYDCPCGWWHLTSNPRRGRALRELQDMRSQGGS
jgi:hypothetical protein